jgi:TRAP transporter 4TM/12TM fusion protein
MLGSISGSSTANVVGTGTFTIPMMKSMGYRPSFAAGVEAAASTGGQFMPPVMGAAAFIMAEVLGVPYLEIIVSAAIPAILYYIAIALMVDKEAVKTGMKGIPRDQAPSITKAVSEKWHMVLPLFTIIYTLAAGYTALFSGLVGVISCVGVSMLRRSTRMRLWTIAKAMQDGAENAILITTACAACGVIIGVFTLTGVGLKIGYGIVELAGGLLFPTLVLTMLTSLLLGMGVPTTANYIITSTVAAPALIALGVTPIAAHLFVFYFGILADITPPVAIAAYAAAAIAKADPIRASLTAARLAIAAFIVPFFFIYNPFLLLLEDDALRTVIAIGTALIGIFAIASSASGYWRITLKVWERIVLVAAAITLLDPGLITDAIGLALIATVRGGIALRERRLRALPGP